MADQSQSSIPARVERFRNWTVILNGLAIAGTAFGFALWITGVPSLRLWVDPVFRSLLIFLGTIALIAIGITRLGRRRLAVAILNVSLMIIVVFGVMGFYLPNEFAIAAFVLALVVTAAGSRPVDTLVTAVVAMVLELFIFVQQGLAALRPLALLSIVGLLATVGITLAWLQDNLERAIQQLGVSRAHYRKLSNVDPLTGLGNRRHFDLNLVKFLSLCNPYQPVALIVLDMDELKTINDKFGHPVGDEALISLANVLKASIRESDVVARIGGDEFAIILPGGRKRGAIRLVDRIHRGLRKIELKVPQAMNITVSVGMAETTDPAVDPEVFFSEGDAELYYSKDSRGQTGDRRLEEIPAPYRQETENPGSDKT